MEVGSPPMMPASAIGAKLSAMASGVSSAEAVMVRPSSSRRLSPGLNRRTTTFPRTLAKSKACSGWPHSFITKLVMSTTLLMGREPGRIENLDGNSRITGGSGHPRLGRSQCEAQHGGHFAGNSHQPQAIRPVGINFDVHQRFGNGRDFRKTNAEQRLIVKHLEPGTSSGQSQFAVQANHALRQNPVKLFFVNRNTRGQLS